MDVPDSSSGIAKMPEFSEPTIQYDDILSISINTLDGTGTSVLGMASQSNSQPSTNAASLGNNTSLTIPSSSTYHVDRNGTIEIPLVGKFSVLGTTTMQIKNQIQTKLSEFYKNPVVDVRFANFRITVLGEVAKPSTYFVQNEKISLFDALGLAGDLTIFGKRENVLLIRDSIGIKQMVRLNLNSKKIIESPYFFLKQNDIIYVEPLKAKIANLDAVQNRYFAISSAILSLLIIIATRVR